MKAAPIDADLGVVSAFGVFSDGHAARSSIHAVTLARSNRRRLPTSILGQPSVTILATVRSLELKCAASWAGVSMLVGG